MKLDKIYTRGRNYPENFFYGDMLEVIRLHELSEGLFLLGKTSEEIELLWGVKQLSDLKEGIEKIKIENKNINFVFRYASNLNDVFEKKKIINQWGYKEKDINIGYFGSLDTFPINQNYTHIECLNSWDTNEFLTLERKIFKSCNVSEKELVDWLNREDYIILVYKENEKIKGFVIVHLYGENNQNCFVRNLAVCETERKKGIGKKLILTGLNKAKKKGAKKSMLWVDYNNSIARELYEKIGYKMNEDEAEIIFSVQSKVL